MLNIGWNTTMQMYNGMPHALSTPRSPSNPNHEIAGDYV